MRVGMGGLGERVVIGRERERSSRLQIEKREIDRTSAIVPRPARGIRDERTTLRRYGFPKELRDAPRTVAVVEKKSESVRFEPCADAQEGFGGRALQEDSPFRIDGDTEEVAVGRVAHVEPYAGIESGHVDEFGEGVSAGSLGRFRPVDPATDFIDGSDGGDAERLGRRRWIVSGSGAARENRFECVAVRQRVREATAALRAGGEKQGDEEKDAMHRGHYAVGVMISPSIRRLLRCCSVLLVAIGVVAAQESRPSPTRVWVLAGQSNMEGNGWLDGAAAAPDVRILRVEAGVARWEAGVEPSHRAVVPKELPGWAAGPPVVGRFDGRKGASPGVAFAAHRARTTRSVVGLIPVAVGGTSLDAWSSARKSEAESLYAKMLARVKASGMKPEGVLWYQGEADAVGKPEASATYAARLDAWIADVRRDLGDPELPVVVAQLCRYVVDRDATGWNTVQEVQRLLPSRVARTECVATIDLSLDDPIHLSADAERRLGVRFAKAVASLLGEDDAPTSGPRPLKIEIEGPRRDRIVVTYRGVNGTLRPAFRVHGFSLADATGKPLPIIFDASVDAARPDTVLLRLAGSVPDGATLWYGRGLDPVCNLVDDEDLAAPVFGPYRLAQR